MGRSVAVRPRQRVCSGRALLDGGSDLALNSKGDAMPAETPRGKRGGKPRHRKRRRADQPQAVYPTFRIDTQRFAPPCGTSLILTSANSKYIGRVGALAVALGVGAVVATGHGLGVARAETGESADSSSADAPTADAADTTPPTEPSTDPPSSPSGENPSSSTPADDSPPDMQVSSSGGPNTSTNDEGQVTDTKPSSPESTEPEDVPPTDTEPPPVDEEVVTEIPVEQDSSVPPEPEPEPEPSPLPDTASPPESNDGSAQSANALESDDAPSDYDTQPQATEDQLAGDEQQALSTYSMQAESVGAPQTIWHTEPPMHPLEFLTVVIPRAVVTIATTVVGLLLTPFLAPGPLDPAQPPLLWVVLGWVRREINRTFFNLSPRVRSQDVTLVLDPDETSEPIAFNGYDFDFEELEYRVPERGQPGGPCTAR